MEQNKELFPGICFSHIIGEKVLSHHRHEEADSVIEINYCHKGQLHFTMENGDQIFLCPGDFMLVPTTFCTNAKVDLPHKEYEGLSILIDLHQLTANPPNVLKEANISGSTLLRFCKDTLSPFFAGNEQSERAFSFFYSYSEKNKTTYERLGILSLLLFFQERSSSSLTRLTAYQSEQIETVRRIHDDLTQNLNKRYDMGELAHKYAMSGTTIKALFKSVYGDSLAAHMLDHRMKYAAYLLESSGRSVYSVAMMVGFESQSRFTSSFKKKYGMVPIEYRRHKLGFYKDQNTKS